jgi:hypothetical protein
MTDTPLECRLRSADCQRMAEHAPNPRIRATLTDMARTWTRLALEAEQTLKENRPPLELIHPDPSPTHASRQARPWDFSSDYGVPRRRDQSRLAPQGADASSDRIAHRLAEQSETIGTEFPPLGVWPGHR